MDDQGPFGKIVGDLHKGVPPEISAREESGEWFGFRLQHEGRSIPVRISREALDDHFNAHEGGKALAEAFEKHSKAILARVRQRIEPGVTYDRDNPLVMMSIDF